MEMLSDEAFDVGPSAGSGSNDGSWSEPSGSCSGSKGSEGYSGAESDESEMDYEDLEAEIQNVEAALIAKQAELSNAEAREDALRAQIAVSEQQQIAVDNEVARLEAAASSGEAVEPHVDSDPVPRPASPRGMRRLDDLVNTWGRARQAMGLGFGSD